MINTEQFMMLMKIEKQKDRVKNYIDVLDYCLDNVIELKEKAEKVTDKMETIF